MKGTLIPVSCSPLLDSVRRPILPFPTTTLSILPFNYPPPSGAPSRLKSNSGLQREAQSIQAHLPLNNDLPTCDPSRVNHSVLGSKPLNRNLTLEFSGARSVSAATPCSAACQSTPPVVQLTQSVIPATRKPFQLPSGIFLYTMSTLPLRCTGAPPGDVINETVYGRHSTAPPPSRKINSLYSGT